MEGAVSRGDCSWFREKPAFILPIASVAYHRFLTKPATLIRFTAFLFRLMYQSARMTSRRPMVEEELPKCAERADRVALVDSLCVLEG